MCKERDSEERFVDQHLEIGEWVEDQLDSPIALDTILFITNLTQVRDLDARFHQRCWFTKAFVLSR